MSDIETTKPEKDFKGDRALKLFDSGLTYSLIAERLGGNTSAICALIQNARKRREKANGA